MQNAPSERGHSMISAHEYVARAHVDTAMRLRMGIATHKLRDVFRASQKDRLLDIDHIFSGLFEHPSRRERDERCAIGRVQECMGEPMLEKLQSIVEASKNHDCEFLRKVVYRILEEGTLAQKKMAARALQEVDPTMSSVVRALEHLVDKPQEKVLEPPSRGGVPHKAIICPNIGGDPHC